MRDKLIQLWNDIKEKREFVLLERETCEHPIGKQVHTMIANEYADIMIDILKIIEDEGNS